MNVKSFLRTMKETWSGHPMVRRRLLRGARALEIRHNVIYEQTEQLQGTESRNSYYVEIVNGLSNIPERGNWVEKEK